MSLFYDLGRQIGRAAIPTIRKSKWIWDGLTGNEEERIRAEKGMGSAMAAELREATELVDDPASRDLVTGLCSRLASCIRKPVYTFHCEVLRDESPNAMALPGGFLYISHSLLDLCGRKPEEVAFVIGHEMAHVMRGHAWDRFVNDTALRAATAVAARANAAAGWLRHKGLQLLRSAHSQDCEFEADELGFRLAAAAGFSPAGSISLLRRIEGLGPDPSSLGQYFASHPPALDRIKRLEPLCRARPAGGKSPPN